MAVREGFEPSILAYTHFPGVLLRPLGHLTVGDSRLNIGISEHCKARGMLVAEEAISSKMLSHFVGHLIEGPLI